MYNNEGGTEGKVDLDGPEYIKINQLNYASMQVFGGLFFFAINTFMGNF